MYGSNMIKCQNKLKNGHRRRHWCPYDSSTFLFHFRLDFPIVSCTRTENSRSCVVRSRGFGGDDRSHEPTTARTTDTAVHPRAASSGSGPCSGHGLTRSCSAAAKRPYKEGGRQQRCLENKHRPFGQTDTPTQSTHLSHRELYSG